MNWWMVDGGWWILRLRSAEADATRTVQVVNGAQQLALGQSFLGY